MSTLTEIEAAAAKLPDNDRKELLRFLLRTVPVSDANVPVPREFSPEQIQQWMDEDEADMPRFNAGQ